jgi:hypothetical protein
VWLRGGGADFFAIGRLLPFIKKKYVLHLDICLLCARYCYHEKFYFLSADTAMDSDIPYPLEFMTDNNFINSDLHLSRNLKANPEFGSGPIRNIDSKQPGLHSVQSVPPIFTNLCHILVSVTVFDKICLKKSLDVLLTEQICPHLE